MLQEVISRFGVTSLGAVQYFDTDWDAFIDIGDYNNLVHKMKIRCALIDPTARVVLQQLTPNTPANVQHGEASTPNDETPTTCKQLHKPSSTYSSWPSPFVYPVHQLPASVTDALNNKLDLTSPKQRHARGLLVRTLCVEAVELKSHPDYIQKVELAKSIVGMWPYLTESIGRGYDGWLASIIDCLKVVRQQKGKIDVRRSAACRKRRLCDEIEASKTAVEIKKPLQCHVRTSVLPKRYVVRQKATDEENDINQGKSRSVVDSSAPCGTGTVSCELEPETVSCGLETVVLNSTAHDVDTFYDISDCVANSLRILSHSTEVPDSDPNAVVDAYEVERFSMLNFLNSPDEGVNCIDAMLLGKANVDSNLGDSAVPKLSSTQHLVGDCFMGSDSHFEPTNQAELVAELNELWSSAESPRNSNKLLSLLKQTFDDRRALVHRSTSTSAIKKLYPALFFREGIVQEYELITNSSYRESVGHSNFMTKAPELVNTAKSMLSSLLHVNTKKAAKKRSAIQAILMKLQLSLDIENDLECQQSLKAIAGLMLLPVMLDDTSTYFYRVHEVS